MYSSDAVLSKPTGVLVLTGALGQSNIPNFKEGVVSLLERYKRVADIKASRVTAPEFQYVFERLLEKVFREYAPLFASDGRFKTSVCELQDHRNVFKIAKWHRVNPVWGARAAFSRRTAGRRFCSMAWARF